MRMKKEKAGHVPGQRHSSAANYEINPQSAMLHDHSDEYVLDLFERMLVSKTEMFVCSLFLRISYSLSPLDSQTCSWFILLTNPKLEVFGSYVVLYNNFG